jgi:hypothetical protein
MVFIIDLFITINHYIVIIKILNILMAIILVFPTITLKILVALFLFSANIVRLVILLEKSLVA